ncbi:glycoside hydrolase family 36 protein [Parathielavia hyrcaniae]|uniref:Glycoside hydrolase family 36 protein n=1 Tax=Parathielavia hyrcaniae TaxID=113614 RepID=A0AAN6SYD9_9PEZI|nr:glycoside hydrolase family 36 protein [Parathielavia hyrcaniae]
MPFVATYPPLGQVTLLKDPGVAIHAVLEVPLEDAAEPWQLSLWYRNGDGGNWALADFEAGSPDGLPTDLNDRDGTATRLYFTAKLEVASSLTFTVKYRRGAGKHEWRWARDDQGLDDGIVVVEQKQAQMGDLEDLPDMIQDLNTDFRWQSHMSQSPGTRLWSIEATVDGANEDQSAFVDLPLGIPWGRFLRWFALVRPWTPWLAPRQGKSEFKLDKDALLCSFLSPQGKHMVFLGMSGVNDVTTLFRNDHHGRLMLHIRSDNADSATATALVAVGDDFESTVATVMYHARTLVAAASTSWATGVAETTAEGDVGPQWYEKWYDGLGYCTWNSLGQELSEQKVLEALDTLAENKISISSLIIDDNWQDIDYRGDGQWQHGWNDFEAEPKAFPRGLKALISDIRSKHKNIQHIAVWHALLGYWAGLAPDGPLAKRYKTVQLTRDDADKSQLPIDAQMTLVAREDVQAFYDDFYRFLSSCDIDGVKTDGQYMLDTWTSPGIRRTLIPAYLDAWTLASLRHFSARVISCMSQSPPIIFHSQLPHNNSTHPPIVCRNSDDYFPPVPDAHPWHVWTNAHNALLTRHLNVLPDWDMFQTVHPHAGFHAAARCVSGGPLYITDEPGRHDLALLRQLTGVSPRRGGKTVVFRPSGFPGRAVMDHPYAGYREGALLKIGAYHGRAGRGTGVVGVFNVEEGRRVVDFVQLERFPGVVAGRRYAVRAHRSGRVSAPLEAGEESSKALLAVSLGVRGYEVLCAYPLHAVPSRTDGGAVLVANLGLIGKMTGCAAVLNTVFEVRENGRVLVDATLKALGVLGVYISTLPQLSVLDDFMVTIQGQPIPPHTVAVNKDDEHVLDVDIETAWSEMGLEGGWANEVEVKVYIDVGK